MKFSPDGIERPALEAVPLDEHMLADITIQALELLLARRNDCVYRGRGWMKLNNACNWVGDSFWSEVNNRKAEEKTG